MENHTSHVLNLIYWRYRIRPQENKGGYQELHLEDRNEKNTGRVRSERKSSKNYSL